MRAFGWLMAFVVIGSVVYVLGSGGAVQSNSDSIYEHDPLCSIITKDKPVFPLQHRIQAEKCEYNELALTQPILSSTKIKIESNYIYIKPGRSNYYQGPLTDKVYIVTDKFQATMYGITEDGTQTKTIKAFPFPIKYGYNEQLEFNVDRLDVPIRTAHIKVIPINYDGLMGYPVEFTVSLD